MGRPITATKTILIVEDDLKNMKLFSDFLHVVGFETVEAADGEQGVELARTRNPDLILMDIMMPKMDGFEATRILKADAATKSIPVIALTSFAMKGDRERTIEAGCDGYLAKPVDIKDLLQAVGQFLPR